MADPVVVIVSVVVVLIGLVLGLLLYWFVYTCVKRSASAPAPQPQGGGHGAPRAQAPQPIGGGNGAPSAQAPQPIGGGHGAPRAQAPAASGRGGTPAAAQAPPAQGRGGRPAAARAPQAAGGGRIPAAARAPQAAGGGGRQAAAQTPQAVGRDGGPAAAKAPQAAGGGGRPAAAQAHQAPGRGGPPTTGHGAKQQATTGTSSAANRQYTEVKDRVMRDTTIERFLQDMANQWPIRFTAKQLVGFTGGYSTKIGHGGFGAVFQGILPNGLAVAVKKLHDTLDRKTSEEQFMAEMCTISRTHHVNLVMLYGFCSEGATKALVYEYMGKGSLDDYLSARGAHVSMDMVARIATDVAKGLTYLHEGCRPKILHLDIKPGNVLLDGDRTPKVADFGLARLVDPNNTHISVSRACGTRGYAPPELFFEAEVHLTEKCDVYSFGILLLTIVLRGRKLEPENQQPLTRARMAWKMYEADKLMEFVGGPGKDEPRRCRELVERMCKVAFWCVQRQPQDRPSMSAVVKMLEGEMRIPPPLYPFQHLP